MTDINKSVKALSIDIEIQILVMYLYVSFIFSNCDYLLILMYLLSTLCKSIVNLSELT